jgi:ArsR family transcriptional regulator, cadmium/lead-responsive transcriptional repressor
MLSILITSGEGSKSMAAVELPAETLTAEHSDVVTADLFQVLASPIRLAVVRQLIDGERCVGDLVRGLGIAQPRLSNHLACLRDCGVVRTRREGSFIYYELAGPDAAEIVRLGAELASKNAYGLEHCPVISAEAERSNSPG